MRVLNYLEFETPLRRSGIATAARHQRAALAHTDMRVLTSPWRSGTLVATALEAVVGEGFFSEFDLVHCNLFGPGSLAVAEHARREGIPLVLHAHAIGEDFAESFRLSTAVSPALGRYLRWFYSRADLVLCPSKSAAAALSDVGAPVRTITNGVDYARLAGVEDLRAESRERFGLDGTVFFAVGNVFERKGVTAFCELAEATDHEFVWFGPYDTGLRASAAVRRWTRNHPENVTFTGWIDDIREAYAAGDVYLFPTKFETQGVAVLEAMACGKAVILRDIPVFEEFYTDGVDCLKCRTRREFREAIDRLADDHQLRERLGRNATETAAEHGLERVAENLEAAYRTAERLAREPTVA